MAAIFVRGGGGGGGGMGVGGGGGWGGGGGGGGGVMLRLDTVGYIIQMLSHDRRGVWNPKLIRASNKGSAEGP